MPVTAKRFAAIDILRGIIMIIMALDHVRDYFHIHALTGNPVDLTTTTPALFLTRWITHFCAPLFVFLSGLSAYISSRNKTKAQMSAFLIKRGLWLIIVEVVVMSFILTFNPSYNIIFLLVLWAIGWSMIVLGLLIRLSYKWVLGVGLLLFLGHNIFDHLPAFTGTAGLIVNALVTGPRTVLPISSDHLAVSSYAILPWLGIMLLGYAAGYFYRAEVTALQRKRFLITTGVGLLLLFLLLRVINVYGDPSPWEPQKNGVYTLLSFLNVTKYPVSLQFSCLTLGTGLLLLAFFETKANRLTRYVSVYGRVPFFYYVFHFLLIHIVCMLLFFILTPGAPVADPNSPFLFRPVNFGFSLPVVYIIWIGIVAAMYYPCYRYDRYKQANKQKWWLSYL